MRRSAWSRVTALFVGLWFVAVSAAPEVTHACPMHGSHARVGSLDSSHTGHGTPTQQSAAAEHHSSGSSESAPQRSNQCSCLGHCCATPPVAVISTAIALADLATVATRDAGLPDYEYVPVAARHILPLAHAPPLSA